jgi:uncharacterized protein YaaR (DUF327 family)
MKVSPLRGKGDVLASTVVKGASEKNMDFSQSFNNANKDLAEQMLKDMLKDIEHFGRRLISTRSVPMQRNTKPRLKSICPT